MAAPKFLNRLNKLLILMLTMMLTLERNFPFLQDENIVETIFLKT